MPDELWSDQQEITGEMNSRVGFVYFGGASNLELYISVAIGSG